MIGCFNAGESIKILIHAGILEVRQGQGTRIVSLNTTQDSFEKRLQAANINHVYEARNMLDKEVAMLASQRRSEEDLLYLKGHLNKRKNALQEGNYVAYIDADIQFHLAIAKASKNEVLLDLYQSFVPALRHILSQLILNTANYEDNSDIHEKLFQAILKQNAEEARTYAVQNLELK